MVFTCSKKEQGLAEGGGVDGSGEKKDPRMEEDGS